MRGVWWAMLGAQYAEAVQIWDGGEEACPGMRAFWSANTRLGVGGLSNGPAPAHRSAWGNEHHTN